MKRSAFLFFKGLGLLFAILCGIGTAVLGWFDGADWMNIATYSIGYSFYKILAVLVIGIPITPLVWQFMSIYKEKNARDKQLSQWEEIK